MIVQLARTEAIASAKSIVEMLMEGLEAGRSSKALPTPVPRDDTALGGPPLPQHYGTPLCGVGRVVVVEVLVVIIIVVVVVVVVVV